MGEGYPPLFSPPLPQSAAPWKPARGSGSYVSSSVGSGAKPRPHTHHFGVGPFELENRTWRQLFFYKRPWKHSCIGKNCRNDVQKFTPNFRGDLEFSGGIPPAICLEETLSPVFSLLGAKVPTGNFRSHERKFPRELSTVSSLSDHGMALQWK